MKAWCDECQKETTRYVRTGGCRPCARRREAASRTPAQRSEIIAKGHRGLTPEQRSERTRAGRAAIALLTAEQCREKSSKAYARMTPEQKLRFHASGGYRRGRIQTAERIIRKRAKIAALEGELAKMLNRAA